MNDNAPSFRRRRALEVGMDAVLDTARRALRRGHERSAERLTRQVLALEPGHAAAWRLLGQVAAAMGKPFDALGALTRALELEPDHAAWQHEYGVICRQVGRYADCAAAMRTAIRLRPYRAASMVELGMALVAMGGRDDAEYWAARALQIEPDNTEARALLEHLLEAGVDAA